MAKLDDLLVPMREALAANNFPAVFSNGIKAFFHLKMAHELWVMNYHAEPEPQAEVANEGTVSFNYTEYTRGRDLLQDIAEELAAYEQLTGVPAMDEMRDSGVLDAQLVRSTYCLQRALTKGSPILNT